MQIRVLDFNNTQNYDTEKSIEIPTTAIGWSVQARGDGNQKEFGVATEPGQVTPANSTGRYISSRIENNSSHQHIEAGQRTDGIARGKPLTLYIAVRSTQEEQIEVWWW